MKTANKAQKAYNAGRMDIWEGRKTCGKAMKKNGKRACKRALRRESKAIVSEYR